MVQLHDVYNYVHQSQHKFRTNRHIEAATRKDWQIFQLQMDKLNQSSRIAELNCQLQVLTSELTQWQTWWEHSADHEAVASDAACSTEESQCSAGARTRRHFNGSQNARVP